MAIDKIDTKVQKLLSTQADEQLDDKQWAELTSLMSSSERARKTYIEYMFLHSAIRRISRSSIPADALPKLPLSLTECLEPSLQSEGSPILGFLGEAFQQGKDFFSRSLVFSFLFAIAVPGIVCIALLLYVTIQDNKYSASVAVAPITSLAPPVPVAMVTQTYKCKWSDDNENVSTGFMLTPGQRLQLIEGLAEITFTDGATALIEGPVTFNAITAAQGFLHSGSLVVQVPKGAEGFSISTPAIKLVDWGTEFGAFVEDKQGTAEVHVFQGEVGLSVSGNGRQGKNHSPSTCRKYGPHRTGRPSISSRHTRC